MPQLANAALADSSSVPTGVSAGDDASSRSRRTALAPLEILARVRIADRVGRSFSPNACLLGFRYFARQGVSVESLDDRRAFAQVGGRHVHRVSLRASGDGGGTLTGSCSCTPDAFEASPCRHQWAAILEIDRRGGFPCLRQSMSAFAFATSTEAENREARRGANLHASEPPEHAEESPPHEGPRARAKKKSTGSREGKSNAPKAGSSTSTPRRDHRPAKPSAKASSTRPSRARRQ